MKVRATQLGYYNHVLRREGDVFELKPIEGLKEDLNGKRFKHTFTVEEQFSKNWMEPVDAKVAAPKKAKAPKAEKAEVVADEDVI